MDIMQTLVTFTVSSGDVTLAEGTFTKFVDENAGRQWSDDPSLDNDLDAGEIPESHLRPLLRAIRQEQTEVTIQGTTYTMHFKHEASEQ